MQGIGHACFRFLICQIGFRSRMLNGRAVQQILLRTTNFQREAGEENMLKEKSAFS